MDVQLLPPTRAQNEIIPLRDSWTHVEDILRCFLPSKSEAGGITKLCIRVEPHVVPRADEFVLGASGFAHVTLGQFDARKHLALDRTKRSAAALRLIARGLEVLAKHHDLDSSLFSKPLRAAAATGFRYTIELKKLCKWHRSRRFRGEVLITYREGGTDVTLRIRSRTKTTLHEERKVAGEYWPSVYFDWFRSAWDESSFVVRDRIGSETCRMDCSGLLDREQAV